MVATKIANKSVGRAVEQIMEHARVHSKGAFSEGAGISLESLARKAETATAVSASGYGLYLESLLLSCAKAVPEKPKLPVEKEDDAESVKSGSEQSSCTTAASSTPPKLTPYEASVAALRSLQGPAITQAILSLQVHSYKDLQGVAKAIFEYAVSLPTCTPLAADLIVALLPFMVTCYNGKEAVTLLDEVKALCEASVATVASPAPEESCFGAVLLLGHLFLRRLVPLANVKDLFMKLLFPEDAYPLDHAANLACHVLLACGAALTTSAGAQMADLVVLRLKDLKGRSYSEATRTAIGAVVEHEAARKLAATCPPMRAPPRRTARGGQRHREQREQRERIVRS